MRLEQDAAGSLVHVPCKTPGCVWFWLQASSHGFYDELFASANTSASAASLRRVAAWILTSHMAHHAVYPGVARALFDVLAAAIQFSGSDVRRL